MLDIDVPTPSKFTKHDRIEEIATKCNQQYRILRKHSSGFPVKIEEFAEYNLEIAIEWDEIPAPEFTTVFAKCCPDPNNETGGIVVLNNKWAELFKFRPDILRSCVGHEVGHFILHHHSWRNTSPNAIPLFSDMQNESPYLHDSSWNPTAFSQSELDELCRKAFKGSEDAHQKLKQLQNKLEPDWMFRQAEHFSMCFLTPHDKLFQYLNDGHDFTTWASIKQLADNFGVSISMMKVRLLKLGAIRIEGGKPKLGEKFLQPGMFRN